ncbi:MULTISPECIES: citrate lyase acyl carrier protein [Clostridium]|uniref:Citrate lyase acyl carrier protein n=1 Tax=Clostridium saccharoperbutylacetonicum N1-4(HMT) TaxID=931276 RepID=M1MPN3_9CLOT|nr:MULTISPECIES: citrate lyase acyl carrier protein [Clostridium]AGF58173.1 citrate lyase acyl carrier protein CitD [Clostridium saccharoperbutylacetonicum N1-4(HMT)]AQR96868.1 citrate lyase acyl carrier protein [Clostridium saccharoperbutylacetonicum]NRT61053.1 citrate lyase subunit gamma (acyl carrier protein) [Clostridium saccharoperbutylacetonicum]NSB24368.1 citrate lyase subunit gamma (acyl carrier protein) [Clostridium saccharoperbutylacetonicum]NSB32746.1 citrate lyase subunit gamma (ac
MEIKKVAMAGTLESSDIAVVIEPNQEKNIMIQLKSSVEKQYGDQIKKVISDTLKELNVESATVKADDKGALDCVIKARVQTAVLRAAEETNFNWGGEK